MTLKRKRAVLFSCLGLIVAALVTIPLPAHAVLGESADSIASDRVAMSAVRGATTVRSNYSIEEVAAGSTTIREYISLSGIVFGIAWNGMVHPDLATLLGSYAGDYNAAQKTARPAPGKRSSQVRTDRVVVEKWGHMRNLRGRAYAPALIPTGVNTDEIK